MIKTAIRATETKEIFHFVCESTNLPCLVLIDCIIIGLMNLKYDLLYVLDISSIIYF